jgi:hypothetical protein
VRAQLRSKFRPWAIIAEIVRAATLVAGYQHADGSSEWPDNSVAGYWTVTDALMYADSAT